MFPGVFSLACEPAAPEGPSVSALPSPDRTEGLSSIEEALTVGGCQCASSGTCADLTYSDKPANNVYYVTTFGGPGDGQNMACGKSTQNGTWAYVADKQRWYCGAKVIVINPNNNKSCIAEVADCGPNRCVEEAACFCGCGGHFPILDVSPYITQYLFGISSSGWSEKRKVIAYQVDSSTPIGCPGGTPAPTDPHLEIQVKSQDIPEQARDFRPEGSSANIFDAYEGQTWTMDVWVQNLADGSATKDGVIVGYWFESPWLVPVHYDIYTDWPAKDQKTWKVNDSNSEPSNPPHDNPPTSGKMNIYAMSPGETKRISFTVKAAQYSIGDADHPDLRAWIWHSADYYGEQTSWDDPVEHNDAGKLLRAYFQTDIYSHTRWEFNATQPETEGWTAGNAVDQLFVNTGAKCLAAHAAGGDPYVVGPVTTFDGGVLKGIEMRIRSYEGPVDGAIYFATGGGFSEERVRHFVAPGDGQFHTVTVSMAGLATWTGTITRLRIDPAPSAWNWYDLDSVRVVPSVTGTSGDSDGDGWLVAPPGADCDDGKASVHPGAAEICDGLDNDCGGTVDDGFDVGAPCTAGVGECAVQGVKACLADGSRTACDAVPIRPSPETCDGLDNDCDGQTDEDFMLGALCSAGKGECEAFGIVVCAQGGSGSTCSAVAGEPSPEVCDGKDNDCDGATDEGVCVACKPGTFKACTTPEGEPGLMLCGLDALFGACLAGSTANDGGPEPVEEATGDHGPIVESQDAGEDLPQQNEIQDQAAPEPATQQDQAGLEDGRDDDASSDRGSGGGGGGGCSAGGHAAPGVQFLLAFWMLAAAHTRRRSLRTDPSVLRKHPVHTSDS